MGRTRLRRSLRRSEQATLASEREQKDRACVIEDRYRASHLSCVFGILNQRGSLIFLATAHTIKLDDLAATGKCPEFSASHSEPESELRGPLAWRF